jgi:Tfp pilus assembly protein PilP
MQGERGTTLAAVVGLGIALVVGPLPVGAEPDGGALRGPAIAIEKARAAADQEARRAHAHDAQAASTFDGDAPRDKAKVKEGEGDTTGSVDDVDAHPEQAQEGAADDKAIEPPTYDVAAHRDPFRPPRLSGTVDARTPLETYQLGQLKLVGVIVESSSGYRAMVEDSAGLGYIITTGTPIGSSGGVVRSIEPRRVVIEESTRDFYGEVKPKEVVMELPQEDRSP